MGKAVTIQELFVGVCDDGSESGSSGKYADGSCGDIFANATDRNWTQAVDEVFRVRFCITETAGGTENQAFILRYNHNSAGWVSIGSTGPIKAAASAEDGWSITDTDSTTDRLSGTGSFTAGEYSEDGNTAAVSLSNQYTNLEFCLTIDSTQVNDGDTILLEVWFVTGPTVLDSYTVEPTITVSKATQVSDSITANAAIKDTQTGSVTADATIEATQTGSVTADATILATQTGSITADAAIEAGQAGSVTADATIQAPQAGSVTADATIEASGWSQGAFRIRSDDSETINSNSGWAADLNQNVSMSPENVFRIRHEISNPGGSEAKTLKYQYRRNDGSWGSWTDLDWISRGDTGGNPVTSRTCHIATSISYTDGAATTNVLGGSGLDFKAGTGEESSSSIPQITLDQEHTEIEMCVVITKLWEYEEHNPDGTLFEFRFVETDDTPLDNYVETPQITVAAVDGLIGGCMPETPNEIGPFKASDGDLFVLVEYTEFWPHAAMMRSTDGGKYWAPVDISVNPNPTNTDFKSVDIVQVSDTLYILHHDGTAVYLHEFNMATHVWGTVDQTVVASASPTVPSCKLFVEPASGDMLAFYTITDGSEQRGRGIIDAGSGWGSTFNMDQEAGYDEWWISGVYDATNKYANIVYKVDNGSASYIYHKQYRYNAGDWDEELYRGEIDSGVGLGADERAPFGSPVFWIDGSTRKLMVLYKDSDDKLYSVRVDNEGTPAAPKAVSTGTVRFDVASSRHVAGDIVLDGSDQHAFWSDGSTKDIFRDFAINDGGWTTDTEEKDNASVDWLRARVFTHSSGNGGKTVVGYIYDNGSDGYNGLINYDEYVIRAGTVAADATIEAGQAASVTANAAIQDAVSNSVTADAAIERSESGSITADAIVQRTVSGSVTADATIFVAQTGSVTADAAIEVARTDSITADATIKVGQSGSITADALIAAGEQADSITADAAIEAGQASSITADAAVQAGQAGSITANAAVLAGQTDSIVTDAVIEAGQAGSITADAQISSGVVDSITADATIEASQSDSITADATIEAVVSGSLSADALIDPSCFGPQSDIWSFVVAEAYFITADAVILAVQSASITANAAIQRTFSDSITANAVIQKAISASVTADATIFATTTDSVTVDAVILAGQAGSVTADAVIQSLQAGSVTADAVIQKAVSDSITADAIILVAATDSITADAAILVARTDSVTVDATIFVSQAGSITADAAIERTFSDSITADAVIKVGQAGSITADATIFQTTTGSITADAWIEFVVADSVTADATIFATISASVTADAYISKAGEGSISVDAAIQKTFSGSITADAIILRVVSGSITANAVIFTTQTDSVTVDAVISVVRTDSIAADAVVLAAQADSITADATIFAAQTDSFTADANIAAIGAQSITADAVIKAAQTNSIAADAAIKRTISDSITADAAIQKAATGSVTADAVVLVVRTDSITADAFIVALIFSITVDAVIQSEQSGSFAADAYIISGLPRRTMWKGMWKGMYRGSMVP
jgi:hypothetical protein